MIIHIINVKDIAFTIPEYYPVVRADFNGPKSSIIARQTMNAATKSFDVVLGCYRVKGVQD